MRCAVHQARELCSLDRWQAMSIIQQRLRHAGQRCRGISIPAKLGDDGINLSLALTLILLLERTAFDRLRCAHGNSRLANYLIASISCVARITRALESAQ